MQKINDIAYNIKWEIKDRLGVENWFFILTSITLSVCLASWLTTILLPDFSKTAWTIYIGMVLFYMAFICLDIFISETKDLRF